MEDDGGVRDTTNDPEAAAALVTWMFKALQLAPNGKDPVPAPAVGQVTATVPVKPPLGVTVIGMVTVFGVVPATAVIVPLPPVMVNVPVLFTVKVTLLEVPPPGAGFVTVTAGVPAVAMSDARMAAISWVPLTNVVVFAAPAKFTVEAFTKFVPFTVRVNDGPPAVALVGESVVIVGTGLLAWVIVK